VRLITRWLPIPRQTDGGYAKAGKQALEHIAAATTPNAQLFIDSGNPLRELTARGGDPARCLPEPTRDSSESSAGTRKWGGGSG
jgi:hypothetical protein